MRRIVTTVHRTLALVAGLFLALLGLSGSATVFTETLMRWETGEMLFPPPAEGAPASFETLIGNTLARYPHLKPSAIISPGAAVIQSNAALVIGQQAEPGGTPVYYIVGLNAHTGEVLGHIIFERSLSMLPYFIHGRLLLPDEEIAHTVLGVLALVIMTMLFTGAYITWPRGARLRNVFVPRTGLPAPARWREWHRIAGLWLLPVLLILALTGIARAQPGWAGGAMSIFTKVRNIDPAEYQSSPPGTCGEPLTETQAYQVAHARFPDRGFGLLAHPETPDGAYLVILKGPDDIRVMGDTWVIVDRACPRVIAARDGSRDSVGDALMAWSYPIHGGRELPVVLQALVVVAGIAPVFLLVTGVRYWLRRRRVQRLLRSRATTQPT